MGRPRNGAESEEMVVDSEVVEATDTEEVSVKPKKSSGATVSITASFKTRTMDGDRVTHKYRGVGANIAEALEDVVGADEDLVDEYNKPFPHGLNMLVSVVVRTSGGYEFSRALAPHVSRNIFENKNAVLAAKLFGL